jgi:hypothetical protein
MAAANMGAMRRLAARLDSAKTGVGVTRLSQNRRLCRAFVPGGYYAL